MSEIPHHRYCLNSDRRSKLLPYFTDELEAQSEAQYKCIWCEESPMVLYLKNDQYICILCAAEVFDFKPCGGFDLVRGENDSEAYVYCPVLVPDVVKRCKRARTSLIVIE